MSFSETMQSFLSNLGMGSIWSRFIIAAVIGYVAIILIKPSFAYNPDGTQKATYFFSDGAKAPVTILPPWLVAVVIGLLGIVFL